MIQKVMEKYNFNATDDNNSAHNFLLLFHVKEHKLIKTFDTDHKDTSDKKEDKQKTLGDYKTPGDNSNMYPMYSSPWSTKYKE